MPVLHMLSTNRKSATEGLMSQRIMLLAGSTYYAAARGT